MTERRASAGPPRYRSYVLRLWAVASDGQPVWRASLQDAHTGERRGFASLAQLHAFLQQMTDGRSDSEATAGGPAAGQPEPGSPGHQKDIGDA